VPTGFEDAAVVHAHHVVGGDSTNLRAIESPLREDSDHFNFAALFGHKQHALLRLRQHDLVRRHAGLALGNLVEFNGDAQVSARAHLAGAAGKPGRAHILNAENRARLHHFQAGFEQQLFEEWVAHLHVGPLLFGAFGKLFAGHGGPVDAVAASLRSDVKNRVADTFGLGVENFIRAHQAQSEGVQQGIAAVAGLEARLAA
jgi:hypothetical protein